jgi:hypothetical protein
MVQAELYRDYAEACFRVAQTVGDRAERARWIDMAQQWLQWAQEEEAVRPKPAQSDRNRTGVHRSQRGSGPFGLR